MGGFSVQGNSGKLATRRRLPARVQGRAYKSVARSAMHSLLGTNQQQEPTATVSVFKFKLLAAEFEDT